MNTTTTLELCLANDRTSRVRTAKLRRTGLSVLEFIGCLMALVGGVWLGAVYLGVDVRHVAYVALADSELLEKVPENWRPIEPVSENAPSQKELAESVQNELVALRHEITALRTTRHTQSPAQVSVSSTGATQNADQFAKEASLEYWARLNDIVHSQATLQLDAESAATKGNATKVAALKGRISRFSASAIRALPTANVDPAAVSLGKELATWYENGAELYDQAVQIWESPARAQSGQQVTQEWEQGQAQHRNEGRLLAERVAAVYDSLTRRFGDGFAPLAGL
jgi:hypothetical protein